MAGVQGSAIGFQLNLSAKNPLHRQKPQLDSIVDKFICKHGYKTYSVVCVKASGTHYPDNYFVFILQ